MSFCINSGRICDVRNDCMEKLNIFLPLFFGYAFESIPFLRVWFIPKCRRFYKHLWTGLNTCYIVIGTVQKVCGTTFWASSREVLFYWICLKLMLIERGVYTSKQRIQSSISQLRYCIIFQPYSFYNGARILVWRQN